MKYFVDAAASAGGDGSEKNPFNKIQQAADIAVAGDEVIVKPGIYREYVNPKHAGEEGKQIVYRSEKPRAAHIMEQKNLRAGQKSKAQFIRHAFLTRFSATIILIQLL